MIVKIKFMDLFVFLLGAFTVLFFISLILSFVNFKKSLELKEELSCVKKDFEDEINCTRRDLQDEIEDVDSELVDLIDDNRKSVESETANIHSIISSIVDKLDAIISRLESDKK